MSRLLCCLCARHADMGAALSRVQEGEPCDGAVLPAAPPTMADVIRERKKKAGGAALGTLRRRIAAAARRPRDARPDRGCEHARFIRSVVSSWRLAEVFLLGEELEAGLALRDLCTQAELAREPAAALHRDLHKAFNDRWWSDIELVGAGFSITAHRAILSARCTYFRDLLQRYPASVRRVPLEGAAASLSCDEASAGVLAVYAGGGACCLADKYERGAEDDLDIINVDGNNSCRNMSLCRCASSRVETTTLRRLAALLGFSLDSLHRDMRYLLDSGESADARLVFCVENGSGAQYGFRQSTELLCHRVVLSARSRFFKSMMARRANIVVLGASSGGPAAVYIDEKVLPRRFARALLHAAYTDQVDLSLIGRNSSSPSSTNSTGSGTTPWSGVSRGRGTTSAMLEDAFQLYEIARFLEMPIAVQGCEDAIVEALCAETLPAVLRWARAPHASQWVYRQAMRYLRDEFPSIMSSSASAALPRAALADALASPFLQASEAQALRGVVRWGERTVGARTDSLQPNVVWHTAHTARRGRRRDAGDAALRELLASLLPHLRLEHLPPDHEQLQQLVRRGVIPAPAEDSEAGSACAWLARGNYRSPRCFLPYLDEIKALLEDQAVPEAELARARRAKYMHRIPDTLYMVAAARGGAVADGGQSAGADGACVSPRRRAALRARVRELRSAPPAVRARALHANDTTRVATQIALRAVRELSLPDACAELLLADADDSDDNTHDNGGRSRSSGEWEYDRTERTERSERSERNERQHRRWQPETDVEDECCSASGSLRYASSGSLRGHHPLHIPLEHSRAGTCRRELPASSAEGHQHRAGVARGAGAAGVVGGAARLSARVPDVAMAPNANTHLLTQHNYFTMHSEYSGGVLQLDLGDGATHTPRPGSRAARAMAAHAGRAHRDAPAVSCVQPRPDEDELRAAIELSVIRAYSAYHPRAPSPALHPPARQRPAPANTLPQAYRPPQQARSLATPSPSSLSASNSGHLSAGRHRAPSASSSHSTHSQEHHAMSRVGSSGLASSLALSRDGLSVGRDGLSVGRDGLSVGRDGLSVGRDGLSVGRDGVSVGRDGLSVPRDGLSVPRDGLSVGREVAGGGHGGHGLAVGSASPGSAASSPSPRRRPHERNLLHHTHKHRSEASRSHSPSDYA